MEHHASGVNKNMLVEFILRPSLGRRMLNEIMTYATIRSASYPNEFIPLATPLG
jgi:hypothetical protein